MFGIGLPELAVIAFFGIVLFGPDKLPQLASQAAKAVRTAKNMADGVRDDLRQNLGDDYSDLELRDLHPRELVRRQVRGVLDTEDADDRGDANDGVDEYDEDYDGPRTDDHLDGQLAKHRKTEVEDAPRPLTYDEGKSA